LLRSRGSAQKSVPNAMGGKPEAPGFRKILSRLDAAGLTRRTLVRWCPPSRHLHRRTARTPGAASPERVTHAPWALACPRVRDSSRGQRTAAGPRLPLAGANRARHQPLTVRPESERALVLADPQGSTMGALVSKLLNTLLGNKEVRVLILGLDNAGKTLC
jgi:hypothetical protein